MKKLLIHLLGLLLCITPIGGRIEVGSLISINFIFAMLLFVFLLFYIVLTNIKTKNIIIIDIKLCYAVILFVFLSFISGFVAYNDELYIADLKNLVIPLLIYSVFVFAVENIEHFNILLKYLTLSCIILAILCIVQTMFFMENRGLKLSGEWGNPNYMAGIITVIFPFLLQKLSKKKTTYYIIAAILLSGVIISFSKSAWIFTILMIGSFVMFNLKQINFTQIFFMTFIVLGLVYYVLTDPILYAFIEQYLFADEAYLSRWVLIVKGIEIFKDNFILGIGMGNYRLYTSSFGFGDLGLESHNIIITVMVENGLPGLLLLVIMLSLSMINYYKMKIPMLYKYEFILSFIALLLFITTHGGGRYFYLWWLHLAIATKYKSFEVRKS